jgi:hypothetical protein
VVLLSPADGREWNDRCRKGVQMSGLGSQRIFFKFTIHIMSLFTSHHVIIPRGFAHIRRNIYKKYVLHESPRCQQWLASGTTSAVLSEESEEQYRQSDIAGQRLLITLTVLLVCEKRETSLLTCGGYHDPTRSCSSLTSNKQAATNKKQYQQSGQLFLNQTGRL